MFGINAKDGRELFLSPFIKFPWRFCKLENLRIGSNILNFTMEKGEREIKILINNSGEEMEMKFSATLKGITGVFFNEEPATYSKEKERIWFGAKLRKGGNKILIETFK
ncbi:MAG: hypothetical protein QMD14_01940 [Candidatus Aenigmarchaeota archaeon]|nr:hypothetical protein [Candidatus Aenigmarchaeota archaeon]